MWAQQAVGAAASAAVAQASTPGALDALERAVDTAASMVCAVWFVLHSTSWEKQFMTRSKTSSCCRLYAPSATCQYALLAQTLLLSTLPACMLQVDARVMEVLGGQHQLFRHCEALRRYLLLGQGDFVQALMELVRYRVCGCVHVGGRVWGHPHQTTPRLTPHHTTPHHASHHTTPHHAPHHTTPHHIIFWQVSRELDQDALNVSEMALNHAVRTALAASSPAAYEEEGLGERLRARKDKSAAGVCVGGGVAAAVTVFVCNPLSSFMAV